MEDQLISFETGKKAKEKGFNIPCVKIYNTEGKLWDSHYPTMSNDNIDSGAKCVAPTQVKLQRWLREIHDIHLLVDVGMTGYFAAIKIGLTSSKWANNQDNPNKTYEGALEIGLQQGLLTINKCIKEN